MPISNLSNGLRTGVCTSTNRPTTPYEGQVIYETDTDKVFVWNASAWKQIPTAATAGAVLQVVSGSTSTQVLNTTSTYADTGLTATITPSSTTNKVLIYVHQADCKITNANATGIGLRLFRGATNIQEFASNLGKFASATENFFDSSTMFLDSPATTSATIYKTQFNSSANSNGTVVQAASTSQSVIILTEISA